MRSAIAMRDWQLARKHSREALIAQPDDPNVVTDAAKVLAMCEQPREAASLMVRAAELSEYDPRRVDFAVRAFIDVGEINEAADFLETAVAANPDNTEMRIKLLGLLKELQRHDRIEPHYRRVIRDRKFDLLLLASFTDAPARKFSTQTLELMLERNPEDLRIRLAEARELLDRQDSTAAVQLLRQILATHPDFAPAHALLGQALVLDNRLDELHDWIKVAPVQCESYPSYWLTLGDWAADRGQLDRAARSYWEATRRDPNDGAAWMRLVASLQQIQDAGSDLAGLVTPGQLSSAQKRIEHLLSLRQHYKSFEFSSYESQREATEIARDLSDLGRNWEAEAWAAVATTLRSEPSPELASLRLAIVEDLKRDASWFSASKSPELAMDLSRLPVPEIVARTDAPEAPIVPTVATTDHLRLSEESLAWGLEGIGANNDLTDPRRSPLVRSIGVGGGAIDYDLDGRADAVVMGAGGNIRQSDSFPNELLRNLGNRLSRVSRAAGVAMRGFGQGLAVGDFNEDGFPDLFFAHVGRNRLLRNNGDGTFTDCSEAMEGFEIEEWTTCGAFVDVDQDGLSDLITTNYCQLTGRPDKPCPNAEGELGPCHPLRFRAADNRFFQSREDGRFRDVTSQHVSSKRAGRSMGIVAGAFSVATHGKPQLGILVANDMTPNAFYSPGGDEGSIVDSAAPRGVAVDSNGRPQASMGIASSDFDRDGDLDFYITGFANEHNIFYEQLRPGYWVDRTARMGMVRPTLSTVGFGTEAVDLDGDGIDELVVTNGHIGDFEDDDVEHEQPFQVFRRGPEGRFLLVDDDAWGDYFSRPHVGRALWTIDVDGDHREDLMITHTKEQVRLLLNRSTESSHRIGFRLVGRNCSRDAVGAIVRFNCGGERRTLWRLSGDGFMCCNERVLRAGLGDVDRIEDVSVSWPDGTQSNFGTLDADRFYLLVQGDGSAFPLGSNRSRQ
jgi:tetratricopeptide (TPR) repeat protein